MTYTALAKTSRTTKTRDDLNGGDLQLLGAGGEVIATVALNNPAGSVAGDLLTFAGFPKTVAAAITGVAIASARLRTSAAADYKTGLGVGLAGSGAQIIVSKLTPAVGDTVTVSAPFTLQHAA